MKKYFWHIIHFIGIFVFIYVLYGVEWEIFFAELKDLSVKRFIVLGVLVFLTDLLRGERFRIILSLEDKHTSFYKAFLVYISGEFWGNISPGRTGEIYKMRYVSLPNIKRLVIILADRGFDLLCMIFLALTAYSIFIRSYISVLYTISAYILIIIFFVLVRANKDRKAVFSILERLGLENILTRWTWPKVIRLIFYSMISEFYFLFWSYLLIVYFLGINIGYGEVFIMSSIITLGSALPISFFGIGTREAVALYFFSRAGYDNSHAVLYGTFFMFYFLVFANIFSLCCWRYVEKKRIRI